jgi:hypothetical protein
VCRNFEQPCILAQYAAPGAQDGMFVLFVLFALSQQQQLVNVTLSLLDQTDAAGSGGAILCQRLLDHRGAPLLLAADDLVLPGALLASAVSCQTLQMTFATTRTRSDVDPSNVTVQLLYTTAQGPGVLFFQRSWVWPSGTPTGAVPLQLTLREGDWDDAGLVQFQLQNASFWPRDLAIWVALYVSMPVDPLPTAQNAFFWLTLAPGVVSTQSNMFYYRDASNLQRWGFVNWTNATTAAPKLSLGAGTTQMQWSATLQCQQRETVAPTTEPTPLVVVPPPPPVNETTLAPVADGNTSSGNNSLYAPGGTHNVAVAVAVPVALVVAIALTALLVQQLRRRRWLARQKQQRETPLVNIREKLLPPEPQTISFDAAYPRNPLTTQCRVFTSGGEMVEVPLRNPQGPYATLLNDTIVTTSDGE